MRDCIPNRSVDLVVCDPPYNINYEYDLYHDNLPLSDYLEWAEQWLYQIVLKLKPNGSFWLVAGDSVAADLDVFIRQKKWFHRRQWLLWHYTFGVNCKRKFTPSHVHLLHYVIDENRFTFNADAIKIPSARQLKYRDKRASAGGRLPDSVWEFPRVCGTFKERVKGATCQLPEALLGRIIKVSSNEGDIVLDPMCGMAAPTVVVAKKLNRHYIGIELSPQYVEVARGRVA